MPCQPIWSLQNCHPVVILKVAGHGLNLALRSTERLRWLQESWSMVPFTWLVYQLIMRWLLSSFVWLVVWPSCLSWLLWQHGKERSVLSFPWSSCSCNWLLVQEPILLLWQMDFSKPFIHSCQWAIPSLVFVKRFRWQEKLEIKWSFFWWPLLYLRD